MAGPAEINFVVTGFSPWGSFAPLPKLLINTSWLIANAFPRVIFRDKKPNIRIFTYPTPIATSWKTARKTASALWEGRKDDFGIYIEPNTPKTFTIDAMIHLGMDDDPESPFLFEKKAFKTKFEGADVDGKEPTEEDLTCGGSWDSCPEGLDTALDFDAIWKQVTSEAKDSAITSRVSIYPGNYHCAYLYYASLATLHNRKETKRVMFVHMPPKNESVDIARGVKVTSTLIEAIADHLPDTAPAHTDRTSTDGIVQSMGKLEL